MTLKGAIGQRSQASKETKPIASPFCGDSEVRDHRFWKSQC